MYIFRNAPDWVVHFHLETMFQKKDADGKPAGPVASIPMKILPREIPKQNNLWR